MRQLVSCEDEEDVAIAEELEDNLTPFKQRTDRAMAYESNPNFAPLL